MQREFTYKGITVTVRRAKVRDRLTRDKVLGTLQLRDVGDHYSRWEFANAVAQSTVSGMAWADIATPDEELIALFNAWLDLDGEVYDKWDRALAEVNAPINDPDLLPPGGESPEKKDE